MALQLSPRPISTSIFLIRRCLVDGIVSGPGRGSCAPSRVPECPPCEPRPPPPCREPTTTSQSGLRVLCCPPPQGLRPPCPPSKPPLPLTCKSNTKEKIENDLNCEIDLEDRRRNACGAQLDRVARRLEAAKRARRLDYENEVAKRRSPVKLPTPIYVFSLAEEHEYMRATDGQEYKVASVNKTESRCDTFRNPPPPCAVHLDPVDNCEIKRDNHLDPCSHLPRIFLEIDRSSQSAEGSAVSSAPNASTNTMKGSGENLSARNVSSFKHKEDNHLDNNVETQDKINLTPGIEKNLCSKLNPPKRVPPTCREPSLIERLRRRTGNSSCTSKNTRRELHTATLILGDRNYSDSSSYSKHQSKVNNDIDTLQSLLQKRLKYKEAGRGRVVTTHKNANDEKCIGAGGIELSVPPSAESVRVRVLLDFNTTKYLPCADKAVLNHNNNNPSNESENWLSIKNLQKKLKGCKITESFVDTKKTEENKGTEEPSVSQPKQNPCALPSTTPRVNHPSACPQSSQRSNTSTPTCGERTMKPTTKFSCIENYTIIPY